MIIQVLQILEARILGSFEPAIEKGPAMAHLNPPQKGFFAYYSDLSL